MCDLGPARKLTETQYLNLSYMLMMAALRRNAFVEVLGEELADAIAPTARSIAQGHIPMEDITPETPIKPEFLPDYDMVVGNP